MPVRDTTESSDETVGLSIHAYPMPGDDAAQPVREAYHEALRADGALRDLLELGCAVAPDVLCAAEDRALGSLLAYAQLVT